jgi:hypothetical protein
VEDAQHGNLENSKDMATDNATTSRGFCVLTHCNVKRLHVAHGVSPSHRILRRRHLSQAFETDFLLGCQSLTAVGEKRLGPSPTGREAALVSNGASRWSSDIGRGRTEWAHGGSWLSRMSRIPRRMVMLPRTRALTNRQRPVDNRSWERRAEHEGCVCFTVRRLQS